MDLILNANGKLVDKVTGAPYAGVAPRDLAVNDTFQIVQSGAVKTEKVTDSTIDPASGMKMIVTQEVVI